MNPEHLLLVIVTLSGLSLNLLVGGALWLQVREMRRESQRFWTGTGGTLIAIWRHLDPDGAARLDAETRSRS